ncbi:iron sulfur assembly protein 1 [Armillaria fumosa]|nr:iron sulfur assembly protein 1 [Armillaria fumosa]
MLSSMHSLRHASRQCGPSLLFARRAMMSAYRPNQSLSLVDSPPVVVPSSSSTTLDSDAAAPQVVARPPPVPKAEKPRPKIRATKAALTITPDAVERLRALLRGPTPQLIRIGVRNKGCAGLSYHLEYVEQPGKFDEVVEQDGVRVVIDSKALFSIIGSEMDWKEDALSSKFAFKNPNIKDACGCGESFNVAPSAQP